VRLRRIDYRAHNGVLRPAWLVLPAGYSGEPVPLVISPHGRGVSGQRNALDWGDLPAEGDFVVICPSGEGRRLALYSWGDPGQIADLARMPQIAEAHGIRVEPHHVYAVGGSMGGQETLLLVARHPHLLAGAVAFDPATDMARRYWDFARLPGGAELQRLARIEIGGTPLTASEAYASRSPDTFVRQIALSGVPLELYWSVGDRVIADQREESGVLAVEIKGWNPDAPLLDIHGDWQHSAEMLPDRRLPRALARLSLLPWKLAFPGWVPRLTQGRSWMTEGSPSTMSGKRTRLVPTPT
jgi:pimeloyl-ACP methyl ester carboxylesterase